MIRYKVIASDVADQDLIEIGRYIASQFSSPMTALKMMNTIEEALLELSNMPHRCSLVDDEHLSAMGYRKIYIKNYTAFFTIDDKSMIVNIERVLYTRRDWVHIL